MSDTEIVLSKIRSLPPLDTTVLDIQRVCADADSSVMDLAKVVERDPMLTANILKATNSPIYGFSKEITNINQAVSLFGMATIKGFALASAVKKSIKINLAPYGINEFSFVDASVKQSALMMNWYKKVDRKKLDILVPASFLMEVGKLIIANVLVEKGVDKEFAADVKKAKNEVEISEIETKYVGISNEEVSSKVFEKWNFDEKMRDSIKYSDHFQDAPENMREFALALHIVKNSCSSNFKFEKENLDYALKLVEENNLKLDVFEDAMYAVKNS